MKIEKNLTSGPIATQIIKLSFPIIGTSFIQMAYNLTDVVWLGRTGSATITAATTAGFFMWLMMSLFYTTKLGAETLVAQSVGKKDFSTARQAAENALTIGLSASFIINFLIIVFADSLLNFFKLEPEVMVKAVHYLRIVSIGMCFAVLNPVMSSVYLGFGNSKTPFYINSIGLIVNMVLDPILIFGLWFIPELGIKGAAIATMMSNILVFSIFLFKLKSPESVLPRLKLFVSLRIKIVKRILRIGIPVAIGHMSFCIFSMCIARIVSAYGTIPLGVQNVGASIEALSWNTALGFSTALAAFTGQNYGARKYDRIKQGYYVILFLSISLGLIATIVFFFFGKQLFSLFSNEQEMIVTGALYLKILAVSQIFMCIEITSAGGFYGLGKTKQPSFTSFLFTGLRIPAALLVINFTTYTYDGIWWCISISSLFKGVIVAGLYFLTLRKLDEKFRY
ncbi:MAG: MATE family efflux transporter [Desulfobacteraceae bacterium]|nr:MATE family efflux transporter [Desulfobacteraceae bacterium]